ncbi:magnesium and cobalt transport protein CorA [Hamadaea sp.]|uniref:magnesium and cobalt transport protein CorA n=1 Tax=Hamadaea sp. TaxID=2024425 RepID=UPI0025C2473C|nr:magnesium and cobalt transport protein CorA [Hamadaea sp.]
MTATAEVRWAMAPTGVVDCAVYVEGARDGGPRAYPDAYAVAQDTPGAFVWLGLHEPTPEVMADVAIVFDLDDLAVEHALTVHSRPTIQRFGEVTYFALRTTSYVEHPELTATSEVVESGSITVFLGARYVITIRHGAPGALGGVRTSLQREPDLLARGPWAVAYAICQRMVDNYLDVSTAIEADVDALEAHVFGRETSSRIAHIYQLKRELMEFKRAVAPLQRPMASIVDDPGQVPKEIRRRFRQIDNTLQRVVERIAAFDDMLQSLLQARLAQVAVDQNNDMRKIAAWAGIAALQTAIAGIYGMNFDFMPELRWQYGYPAILVIMFGSAYGLYRLFRKSGWL